MYIYIHRYNYIFIYYDLYSMYLYVYVYVYAYAYVYILRFMYVCMYVCMYIAPDPPPMLFRIFSLQMYSLACICRCRKRWKYRWLPIFNDSFRLLSYSDAYMQMPEIDYQDLVVHFWCYRLRSHGDMCVCVCVCVCVCLCMCACVPNANMACLKPRK